MNSHPEQPSMQQIPTMSNTTDNSTNETSSIPQPPPPSYLSSSHPHGTNDSTSPPPFPLDEKQTYPSLDLESNYNPPEYYPGTTHGLRSCFHPPTTKCQLGKARIIAWTAVGLVIVGLVVGVIAGVVVGGKMKNEADLDQ